MKKLVVVVDMQKDFVDGALGTKAAQAIVPETVRFLSELGPDTDVVFTRDTHFENYMDTREGKKLPVPHCIRGTEGWEIIPELAAFSERAVRIFDKPTFGSTELAEFVKEQGYDEVTLFGLCTGICVLSNAVTVKAFVPEADIRVLAGLSACVTPESHKTALSAMQCCQITIV